MAPTQFLLPDDDEEPGYSSENRPPNSLSSSEVPKSLLVEEEIPLNFHNRHKHEEFPMFVNQPLKPKPTNVVKGFGTVEVGPPKEKTNYDPVPFRGYPPASNQAYKLTSDGHDPKFIVNKSRPIVTMPSRRKLSIPVKHLETKPRILEVAEHASQRQASMSETQNPARTSQHSQTEGEKMADTIDWNRSGWGISVPGATASFYPPTEQRADFIKAIDDIAKSSLQGFRHDYPHLLIPPATDPAILVPDSVKLQYCKKCRKNHIPPGSPITLPDRDTCGAFLPDWFPTQNYQKPWETFRSIYNEIIICEETERGFNHSGRNQLGKPVWDKEYHDEHPKWRTIGRRHGWWKCRSGPHASEPERTCELCHTPRPTEIEKETATAAGPGTVPIIDRKKELTDWIAEQMKAIGLDDRAMAEEMIRRMPAQQVFGYFPKYKVPETELQGYDTGNDSDPDGEKGWSDEDTLPETPELKATNLQNGSVATIDLTQKGGKETGDAKGTSSTSSSDCLLMRAGKSLFAQ
jgi:hypothetical protein